MERISVCRARAEKATQFHLWVSKGEKRRKVWFVFFTLLVIHPPLLLLLLSAKTLIPPLGWGSPTMMNNGFYFSYTEKLWGRKNALMDVSFWWQKWEEQIRPCHAFLYLFLFFFPPVFFLSLSFFFFFHFLSLIFCSLVHVELLADSFCCLQKWWNQRI